MAVNTLNYIDIQKLNELVIMYEITDLNGIT